MFIAAIFAIAKISKTTKMSFSKCIDKYTLVHLDNKTLLETLEDRKKKFKKEQIKMEEKIKFMENNYHPTHSKNKEKMGQERKGEKKGEEKKRNLKIKKKNKKRRKIKEKLLLKNHKSRRNFERLLGKFHILKHTYMHTHD